MEAFTRSLRREYGDDAPAITYASTFFIEDIMVYKRPEDRQLMIDGSRKAGLIE